MGLEVGGYHDRRDWPKMGPSVLIATCLILAIRTAKWPPHFDSSLSEVDLDREIDYAAHLASRVLSRLSQRSPELFPSKKQPWYAVNDEDVPQ
jgi:hypothetical protein